MALDGLSPKKIKNRYLCEDHFNEHDFTRLDRNRLMSGAIPMKFNENSNFIITQLKLTVPSYILYRSFYNNYTYPFKYI